MVAEETYQSIEKNILTLTQQFSDEVSRYKEVLEKQTSFSSKKIFISPTFHPKIVAESPLAMGLMELIKIYDDLIAMLKLLYLAGCFTSEQDYYANIRRIQKKINRMLSEITFT